MEDKDQENNAKLMKMSVIEHDSQGIMYQDELDAILPDESDFFSILNTCHPQGVRAAYFKKTKTIALTCFECRKPVALIAVGKRD